MAHFVPDHIGDDEVYQDQPNDGENKIKGVMVILYQPTLQQMLQKVGKVLQEYGTDTRRKPDHNAQEVDKLVVRDVFGPPDQEFCQLRFFMSHGHA